MSTVEALEKQAGLALCRYFREGYLNAMAELIQRELQKFDSPEKTEIFFSAHGVPVSYVEQVCLRLPVQKDIVCWLRDRHLALGQTSWTMKELLPLHISMHNGRHD